MQNSLSVRWHGFYLILGICVSWLVVTGVGFIIGSWMLGFLLGLLFGVMFGIGFVCLWVGKYVILPFNSREGVSVGLFTYRSVRVGYP